MTCRLCVLALAGCLGLAGCGRYWSESSFPQARLLGGRLADHQPPARRGQPPSAEARAAFAEPDGVLTLDAALAAALVNNPKLDAFAWEVRAREAAVLQAGLWPNPELELEAEEFGGTGGRSGFDGAEAAVAVGQPLPLGGRIGRARRLAELDRDLAGWDYEARRIEVLTSVTGRFVDVLVAQRRVELAGEVEQVTRQVAGTVGRRVEAGAASPVEQTRADVELASAVLQRKRAERELQSARVELAVLWGSDRPAFGRAAGDLNAVVPVPPLDRLRERLADNPELARWAAEMDRREAAVELARSEAIPDVTVRAGVQRIYEDPDDTSFVMGLAIPLPVIDRNQGNILEARRRQMQAAAERRDTEVRVGAALATAYQSLALAWEEVTTLRDRVLPGARRAFETTDRAWKQGESGFLDVLDAERTLTGVQQQYVDALGSYHAAAAEVEGLIGRPLSDLSNPEPEKGD